MRTPSAYQLCTNPPGCFRRAIVLLALSGAATLAGHSADSVVLRELNRQIAAAPGDAALYFRRAELHRAGGHRNAALRDYAAARRLAPGLAAVDLGLGAMWFDAGKPLQSIAALDQFLGRDPAHADALILRARALARLHRDPEAARDYAAALAAIQPPRHPEPEIYLEYAALLSRGSAGNEANGANDAGVAAALAVLDEGMARLGAGIALELKAIELERRRRHFPAALARLDRLIARSPRPEIWGEKRAELVRLAEQTTISQLHKTSAAHSVNPGELP